MGRFILKRLGISLVILLIVTFIFYLLLRLMPASYVETMAMQLSQTPGAKPYQQWLAQLNAQYGLDTNILKGYFLQLRNLLTFQFGDSWKYAMPVTEKFSQVIGVSIALGAAAFLLELLLAIPLGIWAARKHYSLADHLISLGALIGISLPAFFFATALKLVFSIKLGWFDLYGLTGRDFLTLSPLGQFWDMAKHLVLPVLTVTVISAGSLLRHTRANMLETLNADYIRTARAKGLREGQVIRRHALRNILIPLATILGGSLPGIFAGALVTATRFVLNRIGRTSYQSVVAVDIPFTLLYLPRPDEDFAALLEANVAYALADPRVSLK